MTSNGQGVRVRGLVKTYGHRVVLDGLDLDAAPGEVVALLGRSGSGKTTLLRILAGLETHDGATDLCTGSTAIAFQEPRLLPWIPVWRNVALALEGTDVPHDRSNRDVAVAMLDEVRLADRVDTWPLTLSGGQAHRVALARALARTPQVLLLDEPFAALDALTRLAMHHLLRRLLNVHGPSVLLVTHDIDDAVTLADRVLILDAGRITAEHPVTGDPHQLRTTLLGELGVPVL